MLRGGNFSTNYLYSVKFKKKNIYVNFKTGQNELIAIICNNDLEHVGVSLPNIEAS